MLLILAASSAAAELQVLRGHVPPAASTLRPVDALDPSQRLNLAIGLPLRNQPQLKELINRLYDPADPQYHRYLTTEQFTEKFGPSPEDYQALVAFAQNNGLNITARHSNRMLLSVSASVALIEKVFHVHLRNYQRPSEDRLFYAPDTEPAIEFPVAVLHVAGLDNYSLPKPGGKRGAVSLRSALGDRAATKSKAPPSATAFPKTGSGPGGSYRGNDFRAAYAPGVTLNGVGQRVGLAEFDGYYTNDITTYAAQAGLPAVPLTNVLIDGFSGVPGSGVNDVFEVSLDIEMAASMAPGLAQIVVYETGGYGGADSLLNQMATDNIANQLSCSWWFSDNPTTAQIFQEFAAQGQSFFIIAGDNDAYNAPAGDTVLPPLDYPYATVVGGTTLTTAADRSWASERVWNFNDGTGSGGGISSSFPIPSYQQPVNMSSNGGSATNRNIPDVACVASGLYVVYNNGTTTSGGWGTSFATPLWAAFTALANQQAAANGLAPVGFLNPRLYQIGQSAHYTNAFHDIVSGNNTNTASSNQFSAVPGYDLCTGWGSPTGSNLINLLAPPSIVNTNIRLMAPAVVAGQFQFVAAGLSIGTTNYLQTSADLSSPINWVSIATNIATSASATVGAATATNPAFRFFRLLERPSP